jgi:hypothetical protein
MDIITNFTTGEEAIGAIFGSDQDKGKRKEEDPASSSRGSKRNNNKKKKDQLGKQEAPANDLVTAANRKKPRGPPGGGIFRQNAQGTVSLPQRAHEPQPRGLPHAPEIL